MKPMLACLTACLFAAAAAAQAQTAIQPIKMQMVQPNVQIAQVKDPALEVARLERENKRLREENEALKKRVDDFTRLGGSEVHAYCPADNPTISRNTAGAESDCGAEARPSRRQARHRPPRPRSPAPHPRRRPRKSAPLR